MPGSTSVVRFASERIGRCGRGGKSVSGPSTMASKMRMVGGSEREGIVTSVEVVQMRRRKIHVEAKKPGSRGAEAALSAVYVTRADARRTGIKLA